MNGEEAPLENPLECLTDAVANRLAAKGDLTSEPRKFELPQLVDDSDLETLRTNQRNLQEAVQAFRATTIPKVTQNFTAIILAGLEPQQD